MYCLGFTVQGSGFRVQGFVFRAQGFVVPKMMEIRSLIWGIFLSLLVLGRNPGGDPCSSSSSISV